MLESKAIRASDPGTPPPSRQPTKLFCLYEQEDAQFYRELQKYLQPWVRQQKIIWLEIVPGDVLGQTLTRHLRLADLILLLITPDFLASDASYDAMLAALEEHTHRQVPVIPILAKTSPWRETECGTLVPLPAGDRPIANWPRSEEAYEQIRQGLLQLIHNTTSNTLYSSSTSIPSSTQTPKLFQARELPATYVPRPQAFMEIKRSLLRKGANQTMTTALRGSGGFGKTTLALALYHDAEVQAAFPDGLFWIELGEQPPRLLDLLNRLLPALGDTQGEAITLEEAKERWRIALWSKSCLLVIDDAWKWADLQPLLEGGPLCRRLVTTRNEGVLPENARRVIVDVMLPQEALALLGQGLPLDLQEESTRAALAQLCALLGYWPLLLFMAHGLLATHLRYGRPVAQALQVVMQVYDGSRRVTVRAGEAGDFREIMDVSLQASFRQLEEVVLPLVPMGGI